MCVALIEADVLADLWMFATTPAPGTEAAFGDAQKAAAETVLLVLSKADKYKPGRRVFDALAPSASALGIELELFLHGVQPAELAARLSQPMFSERDVRSWVDAILDVHLSLSAPSLAFTTSDDDEGDHRHDQHRPSLVDILTERFDAVRLVAVHANHAVNALVSCATMNDGSSLVVDQHVQSVQRLIDMLRRIVSEQSQLGRHHELIPLLVRVIRVVHPLRCSETAPLLRNSAIALLSRFALRKDCARYLVVHGVFSSDVFHCVLNSESNGADSAPVPLPYLVCYWIASMCSPDDENVSLLLPVLADFDLVLHLARDVETFAAANPSRLSAAVALLLLFLRATERTSEPNERLRRYLFSEAGRTPSLADTVVSSSMPVFRKLRRAQMKDDDDEGVPMLNLLFALLRNFAADEAFLQAHPELLELEELSKKYEEEDSVSEPQVNVE